MQSPLKIISGGQTGVDRAALDFALERGIPCGGWCPRGRKAEDGPIPAHYPLKELPIDDYGARTWQPLDGLAPRLVGVSARGGEIEGGYRLEIEIPRRVLAREGEGDYTGIGFDVHVNDSDFGHGRDCQMVFAGSVDNYLDPSRLAALAAPSDNPPKWRATVR